MATAPVPARRGERGRAAPAAAVSEWAERGRCGFAAVAADAVAADAVAVVGDPSNGLPRRASPLGEREKTREGE